MATAVTMPKLGLSMVEGTVSHWLVAEGESVVQGDPVVVVETAKINYEVESPASGALRRILCKDGEVAAVGGVIGVIGGADEHIDFDQYSATVEVPAAAFPGGFDPSTTRLGSQLRTGSAAPTEPAAAAPVAATTTALAADDGRVLASPAARRLALQHNLSLAGIRGTGPRGRVQLSDVEAALQAAAQNAPAPLPSTAAPAPAYAASAAAAGRRAPTRQSMRGTMRPVIARNMEASKRTAAHATMSLKANASALVALRKAILASAGPDDVRVTYTDIIVKAVARALVGNPMMRTFIDGDDLVTMEDIDISLAVHLAEAGLIVPVIRDCERLGLRDIAQQRTRLMELGRANKLGPDDSVGGCFTITNMGAVYDLDFGTPIINLPQSAILGVGSIRDEVVAVDGAPAVRPMVNLFLSIDHRTIDGEPAVRFLNQLRDIIADPATGFARY